MTALTFYPTSGPHHTQHIFKGMQLKPVITFHIIQLQFIIINTCLKTMGLLNEIKATICKPVCDSTIGGTVMIVMKLSALSRFRFISVESWSFLKGYFNNCIILWSSDLENTCTISRKEHNFHIG